jgi:hypothetical protein
MRRSVAAEIAAVIERLHDDASACEARARVAADRYDETGDTIDAAQTEYELGRASGLLSGANALHQLRATLAENRIDQMWVGQVPR